MVGATLKDGDPLNVLDRLDELRAVIRQYGVRWVVIDGQNSVVGAPNIMTDMSARHNVTNKLHQFAQQENVALIGIRNEDAEGRVLGPQSMADAARGILRAEELEKDGEDRYFRLVFERISDAARQPTRRFRTRSRTWADRTGASCGARPSRRTWAAPYAASSKLSRTEPRSARGRFA